MKERSPIPLLKLGGGLLLLWPFILLGNLMSFAAAQPDPPPPRVLVAVVYAFLLGSTLYPAVYLPGLLVAAYFEASGMRRTAVAVAWVVAGYLILLLVAFAAWLVLGAWYQVH